jgi:hypothetical protein
MKSRDQVLLEEAYNRVTENVAAPATSPAPSPANNQTTNPNSPNNNTVQNSLNKEQYLKGLNVWIQDLKAGPSRVNANSLQSLHGILTKMYKETNGPLKQATGSVAQFLGKSLSDMQGPQGRAALLFAVQKLAGELENLRVMVSKA